MPQRTFQEDIPVIHEVAQRIALIIKEYTSHNLEITAQALREQWLEYEPNRGIELIKAEQREQYKAVGIPIPVLKAMGNEIAKAAQKDINRFMPLAQLLWNEYGREGHVVALIIFGAMNLIEPERLVPLLKTICKRCVSWEDADRLAMDALEPVVQKDPDTWLSELGTWLDDNNKWVRRGSVTVIGRLPMKYPAYTEQCLEFNERLLLDTEVDVRKAVSFAIRICAKANPRMVYKFLKQRVSSSNPAAVWVLCDVIKSMDRKIIGEF
jgi:3-methyladenine DNA glycosylase AlkD